MITWAWTLGNQIAAPECCASPLESPMPAETASLSIAIPTNNKRAVLPRCLKPCRLLALDLHLALLMIEEECTDKPTDAPRKACVCHYTVNDFDALRVVMDSTGYLSIFDAVGGSVLNTTTTTTTHRPTYRTWTKITAG